MVAPRAQGVEPCIRSEHGEWHLHDTLLDTVWEGRAKLLGGRLKQALYTVSLLQVLQEVFLGSEELCADMAPANLNFA